MKRTLKLSAAVILGGCAFAGALAVGFQNQVRVESKDGRRHVAHVNTGNNVRLVKRLSDTRCVEGRNWGYDNNEIWVDDGCRAVFEYGWDRRRNDEWDRRGSGDWDWNRGRNDNDWNNGRQ